MRRIKEWQGGGEKKEDRVKSLGYGKGKSKGKGKKGKDKKHSGSHDRDQSRDRSLSRATTKNEQEICKAHLKVKRRISSKGLYQKVQSHLQVFPPRSMHQWKGLRVSAPLADGSGE